MVTSVCVVETMIGAAAAAPTASATTTATTPLSVVHLRNACGIQMEDERLRGEVVVVRSPDSSGGAAPQIESPQNRHLDLLVCVNCHGHLSICQNLELCSGNTSKLAGLRQFGVPPAPHSAGSCRFGGQGKGLNGARRPSRKNGLLGLPGRFMALVRRRRNPAEDRVRVALGIVDKEIRRPWT
jgi:hypothetical protein